MKEQPSATSKSSLVGMIAFAVMLALFVFRPMHANAKGTEPDTISARRAFVEMPVQTLELLSRSTRMDMLDYFDVDSIYRAPNAVEGRSWLEKVTPDYLKVVITPVSTLEIKVLPYKKGSSIVMAVYTVGGEGQAADSELWFYDASMNPMDASKIWKPARLIDFFNLGKKSELSFSEIEETVEFPTVEYIASPDSDSLKAVLTVDEFIDRQIAEKMKPYLVSPIVYEWNGSTFRLLRR